MKDKNVLVILNARAANDQDLHLAFGDLYGRGYRFDIPTLSQAGDARRVVAEATTTQVDLILMGGGDGTLNEAVSGLQDAGHLEDVPVALMPFGTGNDFATGCGFLPDTPEVMLHRALAATELRVDLGRADERIFVNAVSGGVGAEATAETPDWLKAGVGKLAYFLTGAVKAGNLEGKEVRFTAEGFAWTGKMLGFVVGNGSHAGGNVRVSPNARVDDGLLDLTIFPECPFADLTNIAAQYMFPTGDALPEQVITAQAPAFTLRANEAIHINLDGEPLQIEEMQFGIMPGALRFLGGLPGRQ